jgi:hypothetical protein
LPTEGSFFESETVEQVQNSIMEPIEKTRLFNGELWKFKNPIPNRHYIMGVDTAPEHGEDKSALTVWDYETLEQVAEYQGKCKVLDYVKVVKVVAAQFPGTIVIESNSYGNQVVEQLNNSEFSFMIYKERRGKQTVLPGLSTNSKTRPLMIDALYSYITQYPECVNSERLSLELTGLVTKTNGRVEADTGCHDDLALATSCVFYVRKYDPPLMIDTQEYTSFSSEMVDVIAGNTNVPDSFSNEGVMKHVKENIGELGGFVDILSLYDQK